MGFLHSRGWPYRIGLLSLELAESFIVFGTLAAGNRSREQREGQQHPAPLGERHVGGPGPDVVLACEVWARCRSHHDRQTRRGRHVLRPLERVY